MNVALMRCFHGVHVNNFTEDCKLCEGSLGHQLLLPTFSVSDYSLDTSFACRNRVLQEYLNRSFQV